MNANPLAGIPNPFRQTIVKDAWESLQDVPEIHAQAFEACCRAFENVRTSRHCDSVLLHGGAGSGKTEWLRVAIQGLIRCNTPKTLRFVLIDPKRTAFNEFANSPYLLTSESLVFPDAQPVEDVLKELVREMERRYVRFQKAGVDNVNQYAESTRKMFARIVCVCDEYYALIAGDSKKRKEIETQISFLGAKARAAGIHLVLATQQPSREVVKGVLDSNIPARVGLMMVKKEESKMLLGRTGAENLLGKGDLLFRDVGDPVRLQAPLLSST